MHLPVMLSYDYDTHIGEGRFYQLWEQDCEGV